jgi:inward rectifier potassium channel
VLIKSFNESFSQVVHSRTSYSATEFLWGQKFVLPYTFDEKMKTIFDLKRLSETTPI